MIGVKITVLLILFTVTYRIFLSAYIESLSLERLYKLYKHEEYPAAVVFFGLLVIIDWIGVIYSVIYFLFLR